MNIIKNRTQASTNYTMKYWFKLNLVFLPLEQFSFTVYYTKPPPLRARLTLQHHHLSHHAPSSDIIDGDPSVLSANNQCEDSE